MLAQFNLLLHEFLHRPAAGILERFLATVHRAVVIDTRQYAFCLLAELLTEDSLALSLKLADLLLVNLVRILHLVVLDGSSDRRRVGSSPKFRRGIEALIKQFLADGLFYRLHKLHHFSIRCEGEEQPHQDQSNGDGAERGDGRLECSLPLRKGFAEVTHRCIACIRILSGSLLNDRLQIEGHARRGIEIIDELAQTIDITTIGRCLTTQHFGSDILLDALIQRIIGT